AVGQFDRIATGAHGDAVIVHDSGAGGNAVQADVVGQSKCYVVAGACFGDLDVAASTLKINLVTNAIGADIGLVVAIGADIPTGFRCIFDVVKLPAIDRIGAGAIHITISHIDNFVVAVVQATLGQAHVIIVN